MSTLLNLMLIKINCLQLTIIKTNNPDIIFLTEFFFIGFFTIRHIYRLIINLKTIKFNQKKAGLLNMTLIMSYSVVRLSWIIRIRDFLSSPYGKFGFY